MYMHCDGPYGLNYFQLNYYPVVALTHWTRPEVQIITSVRQSTYSFRTIPCSLLYNQHVYILGSKLGYQDAH